MPGDRDPVLTVFGALAALTMVVSYAFEARHQYWIAVFAVGCAATAVYGLLTSAWIFAILETVWAAIAINRFRLHKGAPDSPRPAH